MIDEPRIRLDAWRRLTAILRGRAPAGDTQAWPDNHIAWDAFLDLAARHALLPAVWSAWHAEGRPVLADAVVEALERAAPARTTVPEVVLRRAYDASAARTTRLLDVAGDALARLDAAGVTVLPLKGLHMLLTGVWPDPAARTMADLDLLVPAAEAAAAYAVLHDAYEAHPDLIGEHADHHLPMLRRGDVTVELHTELLVSRWRALAPAAQVLARAQRQATELGSVLLASDTDTFVHLIAHAQLQDDTYRLLGVPLRALLETARWLDGTRAVDHDDVRRRFARAGVTHVLDAHMDATNRWFGGAAHAAGGLRGRAHSAALVAGVAVPGAVDAWDYLVRVPQSFTEARMLDEFGAPSGGAGPAWLWHARARHAARRIRARVPGQ